MMHVKSVEATEVAEDLPHQTLSVTKKVNDNGVVLIPQPSDDPDDPLVRP